jgi:N-methylhydantoinase B
VNGLEEHSPSKFLTAVDKDDVLRVRLSGGGGHGSPLGREPWRVLADVQEEKITPAHAKAAYGIVLEEAGDVVDEPATRAIRAELENNPAAPARVDKPSSGGCRA